MDFIRQPAPSGRLGDHLKHQLAEGQWARFRAAVAFVKRSGTRHIVAELSAFAQCGEVEFIVGVDHGGTSCEGLRDLLDAVAPRGRVLVFHNRLPFTFHPKVYLFSNRIAAHVLIGSGNLTEGGLFTNYECGLSLVLDLTNPDQAAVFASIDQGFDSWTDPSAGTALALNDELLAKWRESGLVPSETSSPSSVDSVPDDHAKWSSRGPEWPFKARSEPRAPTSPTHEGPLISVRRETPDRALASATKASVAPAYTSFVMTLHQTDVGDGQTGVGTSRWSPEIFVPLAARNACPAFWSWPEAFESDPNNPNKRDRRGVRVRLGEEVIAVNMMEWLPKHDLRLRSEALRSAGSVGDILRMERVERTNDYEYIFEIIATGADRHRMYLALCRHPVRNSEKRYGYY